MSIDLSDLFYQGDPRHNFNSLRELEKLSGHRSRIAAKFTGRANKRIDKLTEIMGVMQRQLTRQRLRHEALVEYLRRKGIWDREEYEGVLEELVGLDEELAAELEEAGD